MAFRMEHPYWRAALAGALLPVLAQCLWLYHNTQLPVADADEQLSASYFLYKYFTNHDWGRFFSSLYDQRIDMWRPTGLYLLLTPFQIGFHGDLMLTTAAFTLLCTMVTCLYIYRFLRLCAEPTRAAVGTLSLGLLSTMQWPGTLLGVPECAFLPAVLATLYHLMSSHDMREGRHCFYFVLAGFIAFAIQPIEAVKYLSLPFVLFLFSAHHRKVIKTGQLYRIIAGALVSLSVLITAGWLNHGIESHSVIFADPGQGKLFAKLGKFVVLYTAFLCGVGLVRPIVRRITTYTSRAPYIEASFYGLDLLVVLFYVKFVPQLFEWIYTYSFANMEAASNIHPIELLSYFIHSAGIAPFYILTIAGLIAFCFCVTKDQRKAVLMSPVLYLLSSIVIAVGMIFFAPQFALRNVAIAMDLFLLAMTMSILAGDRLKHLRTDLLIGLAVLQLYVTFIPYTDHPAKSWMEAVSGTSDAYPKRVTLSPNPNKAVLDFIELTAREHGYSTVLLPIDTHPDAVIDPLQLSMLAGMANDHIRAQYPLITFYDDNSLQKMIKSRGDAFLYIKDKKGELEVSSEEEHRLRGLFEKTLPMDANNKLRYQLGMLYAGGKFDDMGIRKVTCFTPATGHEACIFELPEHKTGQ